jgi:hypothetical protein
MRYVPGVGIGMTSHYTLPKSIDTRLGGEDGHVGLEDSILKGGWPCPEDTSPFKVKLRRDKHGRIDCYDMMNNLDNLPPRLEFFTRLGECLEAGDEGDFLKQQQTLFGTVNSDIGGIRAYREMDQMMRAMWLLLCRLLDMWT